MIANLLLGLSMAAATPAPEARAETIYVLRGEQAALDDFRRRVGDGWSGGTAIDAGATPGTVRYWAYANRTAAQSRAFIIPATVAGLAMDFEDYEEAVAFPDERRTLDAIAAKCGAGRTVLFVTPVGMVDVQLPADAPATLARCLSDGVRAELKLPVRSGGTSAATG